MINCPACGKENEDSAFECKRCRAPLREDVPEEVTATDAPAEAAAAETPAEEAAPPAAAEQPASSELGTVCRRCEAYNEPGVRVCTACGYDLFAEALEQVAEPPLDKTPPQAYAPENIEPPADSTPPDGQPSLSDELSALALSDQEAAEAGMSTGSNGAPEEPPLDKTPPQAYAAVEAEPEPPAPRMAQAAAAAEGGAAVSRRAPEAPPPPPPAPKASAQPPPAPAAAEKTCANCGASNPPAAKFCFDCGTPFAKKAEPAPAPKVEAPPPPKPAPAKPAAAKAEPPPSIQIDSSIHVDEELGAEHLTESTAESAPVPADEPAAEELPAEEAMPEEEPPAAEAAAEAIEEAPPPEEEPVPAESVAEPIEEEAPPPFAASLVIEKGSAQGTAFVLAHLENSVGGSGTAIELAEDPFIAPHAATLLFADDHLVVRDEGSANGVLVKLREPAALEAGDHFVAGERLFRFDGPAELPKNGESDTPFLGAPRPQAAAVRVTEVLAGGKTGRTCHRSGPLITIGRTGCDMNFPADSLLAAKHVEIRLGEDGSATLVDLGQTPTGVWLRLRPQGQQDLMAGDLLQIGDQQLRVEVS